MKTFVATVSALALFAALTAAVLASSLGMQSSPVTKKPPTILFMCPHGAAKSVLASAYFQRLAKERGLNVRVESAGTNPIQRSLRRLPPT